MAYLSRSAELTVEMTRANNKEKKRRELELIVSGMKQRMMRRALEKTRI